MCGRTPEAEVLTSRAIAPTPAEVGENPRSKSAKLRGARKLEMEVDFNPWKAKNNQTETWKQSAYSASAFAGSCSNFAFADS